MSVPADLLIESFSEANVMSRFVKFLLSPRRVMASVLGICLVALLTLSTSGGGAPKKKAPANTGEGKHDPANAVANLDVHKDLEATLFASEPAITNPTNLDIDY